MKTFSKKAVLIFAFTIFLIVCTVLNNSRNVLAKGIPYSLGNKNLVGGNNSSSSNLLIKQENEKLNKQSMVTAQVTDFASPFLGTILANDFLAIQNLSGNIQLRKVFL